jgi:hypothetical protein
MPRRGCFLGCSLSRPFVFVAAGVGSFVALCTFLFGPRVLSVTFAERLLEPLLLYATGFGTRLLNWAPGWGYWYNLVGPGLAVATVGVLLGYGRRGPLPPRAVLYGAAASLVGLAMLFKWVNRSIDILWSLNGGLVVAVAAWWVWVGWQALAKSLGSETRPMLGLARQTAAAAALITGLVVFTVLEKRTAEEPTEEGGRSSPLGGVCIWLDTFRNPINAARRGIGPDVRPSPIDPEATEYLHRNTLRRERVAVICGADWHYLVDAGRAPRLYWVQLFLVHSPVLLDRCAADLEQSERVFVDKQGRAMYNLMWTNPAAYHRVQTILNEHFEIADDSSKRWDLYRRKPVDMPGH